MLNNIKDKYFLGFTAGIIVTLIGNIIDYLAYLSGITKYHIWHIAASAYFPIPKVKTLPALIVGAVSHTTLVILVSLIITYLLYITGIDYFWAKGAIISLIFWLIIFGIVLRTKIGRIDPIDAGTNLFFLGAHLIAGIAVAWIITKYGQKALAE